MQFHKEEGQGPKDPKSRMGFGMLGEVDHEAHPAKAPIKFDPSLVEIDTPDQLVTEDVDEPEADRAQSLRRNWNVGRWLQALRNHRFGRWHRTDVPKTAQDQTARPSLRALFARSIAFMGLSSLVQSSVNIERQQQAVDDGREL